MAGEFTKISELRCAVQESALLAFQTFLTTMSGPNQKQTGRRTEYTASS